MENRKKISEAFKFTLAGVIFGMIFPILSTSIEIVDHNLPYTIPVFFQVQKNNALLWIIDAAVPLLGFFGYHMGRQQEKIKYESVLLEELVELRSEDILKQKLFYEALIENSPIAIVTLDSKHCVLSSNPAFEGIFGYRNEEIQGKNLDEIVSDENSIQEAHEITKGILSGETMHTFGKRRKKDGTYVDVEILGKPINLNEKRIGVLGLYRDITAEKTAREALIASEERFRNLFQDSPIALRLEDCTEMRDWIIQKQEESGMGIRDYLNIYPDEFRTMINLSKIVSMNNATLSLFHAKNKEHFQENIGTILSEDSVNDKIEIFASLIDGVTQIEKELIYQTLDGEKIYVITKLTVLHGHESNWKRILFSNMDITERKLAEDRMTYVSLHDMMTGLYNRAFFDEEMDRLDKSRLRPISVLVGDMDNLKEINDKYGHHTGDLALKNIANILRKCFRDEDLIARIGGDEFSILLSDVNADLAKSMTRRIQTQISAHNNAVSEELKVYLSIGAATAGKGDSVVEAYKTADKKMYQDKLSRKNKLK